MYRGYVTSTVEEVDDLVPSTGLHRNTNIRDYGGGRKAKYDAPSQNNGR